MRALCATHSRLTRLSRAGAGKKLTIITQGGHQIELEGRGASHQLAAVFGQLGNTAK